MRQGGSKEEKKTIVLSKMLKVPKEFLLAEDISRTN